MKPTSPRSKPAPKGPSLLDGLAALLRDVLSFEHPADAVVSRHFRQHRQLGPRERATLANAVYAVLRELPLMRHLAQAAPKGSGSLEHKLGLLALWGQHQADAQRAAQAALAQVAEPLSGAMREWLAHAASLRSPPGAAESEGRTGLPEALRHCLPDWLAQRLQAEVGAEFWPLVASFHQPAPLDLRVNLLKASREQAEAALKEEGLQTSPTPMSPWGLRLAGHPALEKTRAFREGWVEVQDEGSQLLALMLEARRGELVVDFCAGAGGKTLALGAAMRGTGRLYAFDVSAARLEKLKPRLVRSGLQNVTVAAIAHERDERVKRLHGKADRVLVDAPCTGLGTLRRNPDLKWRQSEASLAELVAKQQAILAAAARLLKPGGRLVYATCSVLQAECEGVAAWFDAGQPGFKRLGPEAVPGLPASAWDGQNLRLWPHRHGTDGFFAAAWEREAA
jgi:16S rRNA (cytosine967-C5)-methyltransferase